MFRTTMAAAQVGIFVLQDQRFKFVNPFLAGLLGYSEEELIGRMGPLDVVTSEYHGLLVEKMALRAAGSPGPAYELEIVRKDGSHFPATILGAPALIDGRPASVGTLLDISVQKAAEQRIRELLVVAPELTVIGLPEGNWIQVAQGHATLGGPNTTYVFKAGEEAVALEAGHQF